MNCKHLQVQSTKVYRISRFTKSVILFLALVWIPWLTLSRRPKRIDELLSTTGAAQSESLRILYIVTTLSEYDTGTRSTVKGNDRLQQTLIPVVRESIESIIRAGYHVDLYLICNYNMTRRRLIEDALPSTVGLEIWDNATPLGYKLEDTKHNYTQGITRALARQHRFVIKDKLLHYDFFVNFEDDMLITGSAIQNYIEVMQELYRLRAMAPDRLLSPNSETQTKKQNTDFFGVMTKAQLRRMIPGFIRVEVLLDEATYGAQEMLDPVPVSDRPELDAASCCHVRNNQTVSDSRPPAPQSDTIVLWETNIKALGVRKMPLHSKIDWVVLQRGPRVSKIAKQIADYWSGTDGYYQNEPSPEDRLRPDTGAFKYINNMGGWMASREQIWEWHTEICPGGFLPPYESPEYNLDGLDKRNVEYWSGGLSIFTKERGCNLQRIIPLDPQRFAKSLVYHTANNKQRQFTNRRHILVKANDLLGELNTVRKNAEAEMYRRIIAMNKTRH